MFHFVLTKFRLHNERLCFRPYVNLRNVTCFVNTLFSPFQKVAFLVKKDWPESCRSSGSYLLGRNRREEYASDFSHAPIYEVFYGFLASTVEFSRLASESETFLSFPYPELLQSVFFKRICSIFLKKSELFLYQ